MNDELKETILHWYRKADEDLIATEILKTLTYL
jgi:hypothetical protein